MSSSESFEKVWVQISSKYELPEQFKLDLKEILDNVGYGSGGGKKAKSGYSMYITSRVSELKESGMEKGRMEKAREEWSELKENGGSKDWNEKAKGEGKVKGKKGKKGKAPSAYNMYVKDKMPEVKERITEHKERMGEIGKMWKELSEEEKKEYKEKAEEQKASNSSE